MILGSYSMGKKINALLYKEHVFLLSGPSLLIFHQPPKIH